MNKETFGAFIAQVRKEKGMTQQKLADQLHVTDKAISKWERGICYPDLTLMENLATALNLTVTELMACQRQPEEREDDAAVRSLLDISDNALKAQRKSIWIRTVVLLLLILSIASGTLFFSTNVSELRYDTVTMKQMIGDDYFIYVEDGSHLLRLQCPDQETYNSINADDSSIYKIKCSWNRLNYKGMMESCELDEEDVILGGMMDQIGASIDFGSVLGIDCVWQEYKNIYPDTNREGGWLFTYRLWYSGDGSDYFAEGEDTTLITAEDCRSICADDFDEDGVVELFVLTQYDEEPYMLYELESGEIIQEFIVEIPDRVAEFFKKDTSWY